jgi:hypothetical protein
MSTNSFLTGLKAFPGALKRVLTDTGSEMGAWLAPLPSAVSVATAASRNLHYDPWLAFVVGAIVELLGFATANRALDLWDYNQTRREDEPKAPTWLAVLLVSFYLFSTISLSVLADLLQGYIHLLPALFPLLAVTGTLNVALGRQQARRVERNLETAEARRLAAEKAEAERKAEEERKRQERKEERDAKRQASVNQSVQQPSIDGSINAQQAMLQAGRAAKKASIIDAMLNVYRDNPFMGDTELGGRVGVTRQTIYNYKRELEKSGRVHINGNGVEVKA